MLNLQPAIHRLLAPATEQSLGDRESSAKALQQADTTRELRAGIS
jgi:hypothetical protein